MDAFILRLLAGQRPPPGRNTQHGYHGPPGEHGGTFRSQRPEGVGFFLNNGIRLVVRAGDVTALEGGAVLAGENNNFTGGGGIANALLRKGGEEYFEYRRKMINEYLDRHPCPDVVLHCPAGDQLPFTFVFHALLTFHTDRSVVIMNNFEQLVDVYGHVLDLATRLKITSIVMPLLGSGASGGRFDDCLKAAFVAISNLKDNPIETITIVEYDRVKAQVIGMQLKDCIEYHALTRHQSPASPRPSYSPAPDKTSGHPAPDQKTPDLNERERHRKPTMKHPSAPTTSTGESSRTPQTDFSLKRSQRGMVSSSGTVKGESLRMPPRNHTPTQQPKEAGAVCSADGSLRATLSEQVVNRPPGFYGKRYNLMPDARPRSSLQPQSEVSEKQTSQEQHKESSRSIQVNREPRPDDDSKEEKQSEEPSVHMPRPPGVPGGGESLPAEGLQSQDVRPGLTRGEEGGSFTTSPNRARLQVNVTGQMGVGAPSFTSGRHHSSSMEGSEQGLQHSLPPDSLSDFSFVGDRTAEAGGHAPGGQPTGISMKSGDFWWDFFDLCNVDEEGNSTAHLGPNRDVQDLNPDRASYRGMQDYGADNSFQHLSRSEFDAPSSIEILSMASRFSDFSSFAAPTTGSLHQAIPNSEPEDEPEPLPDNEGATTEPVAESQGPFPAGHSGRDSETAKSSDKETLRSIVGTMPTGSMNSSVKQDTEVPGFEGCGVIVVDYDIPDGIQKPEHPQPGSPYCGCVERAFLPDNAEGRRVLGLLEEAFDRRLTFQVCEQPGGQALVEWADIPHKTCLTGTGDRGGYPDPDYLATVQTLLRDKYGIE